MLGTTIIGFGVLYYQNLAFWQEMLRSSEERSLKREGDYEVRFMKREEHYEDERVKREQRYEDRRLKTEESYELRRGEIQTRANQEKMH